MPLVIPIFVRGGEGEQGSLNFQGGGGVACEQADLCLFVLCCGCWGFYGTKLTLKSYHSLTFLITAKFSDCSGHVLSNHCTVLKRTGPC